MILRIGCKIIQLYILLEQHSLYYLLLTFHFFFFSRFIFISFSCICCHIYINQLTQTGSNIIELKEIRSFVDIFYSLFTMIPYHHVPHAVFFASLFLSFVPFCFLFTGGNAFMAFVVCTHRYAIHPVWVKTITTGQHHNIWTTHNN